MKVENLENIQQLISENATQVSELGVQRIGIFGSYAKGQSTEKSDIDFIVEFQPGKKTYDNFIQLAYYLEELLGRKVELLTPDSLTSSMQNLIEPEIQYILLGELV